jgi:hypothetical protein
VSEVLSRYPHLQPGLCGCLECAHICSRVCHCEAGLRRGRARLAAQAVRRFRVIANSRQEQACSTIHKQGLCPHLCREVGGCFLPRDGDHPSESKRKVFRCQRAVDALVRIRTGGEQ